MLTTYPLETAPARAPVWLDLAEPTPDELREAGKRLGAALPPREEISSIALSKRMRASPEMISINLPAFARAEAGQGMMTPLGIVVTPELLVTTRYAESEAFKRLADAVAAAAPTLTSIDAFVLLFESIVSAASDRMQRLSVELSEVSHQTFCDTRGHSQNLRGVLFRIGRIQRQVTQTRSATLGVQRGLMHLCDAAPPWIDKTHLGRLRVALEDVHALGEFDQQLDDKVQFLLDAALGFINNDQNDIIRVLTIASVVTIPPMILAGIWGMNFKSIHEYDWPHGYAYALAMIVLSMILPLAWFKWKKWF